MTFSCLSPFPQTWKTQTDLYNDDFILRTVEHKVTREFRFALAYQFGSLSESLKKIRRGIVNDDL